MGRIGQITKDQYAPTRINPVSNAGVLGRIGRD